jgi:TonB family protein
LCSAGSPGYFADREKLVVVPQSKPFRSRKILSAFDRTAAPETSSNGSRTLDESSALASLKELISAGDHRLDPILATITDAARQLTGASGAALAMWKEGEMVCRARSGDTAPVLGARLSAETGISGECLRTGKVHHCADTENDPLVDVEVCRSLGLRSIAVLPIQGWRGINGILEVFSTKPAAFTEQHITLLRNWRAPSGAPRSRTVRRRRRRKPLESAQPLPACCQLGSGSGDVALAFLGTRSRPMVLGIIGLVALALLALVIWLGWRGPEEADAKARAAAPSSVNAAAVGKASAHPPDNDPVWKANPGGEALYQSNGKSSAGTAVQLAAKVDVIAGTKPSPNRPSLLADVAADVAVPHGVSGSRAQSQVVSGRSSVSDSSSDEAGVIEAPAIPAEVTSESALRGVLSAKSSLPGLAVPVSQGVSGGQLVRRVPPVYPAQALLLRMEGTVVLAATVMEDGAVRDVRVVQGAPVLARSAVDAVKVWRYKPYRLDGTPVKNEVQIRIDFKLPGASASR